MSSNKVRAFSLLQNMRPTPFIRSLLKSFLSNFGARKFCKTLLEKCIFKSKRFNIVTSPTFRYTTTQDGEKEKEASR